MVRNAYRSPEEKVGHTVLFPFKVIAIAIAIPLFIITYPFVTSFLLLTALSKENRKSIGSVMRQIDFAFTWPLAILALNDFASLGGHNIPALSSISDWLIKRRLSNRH